MTKKEKLEAEYRKQIKRIRQWERRNKPEGAQVVIDAIPKKPKRITEGTIRRLEKLTPEKLRKKVRYVEPETGEVLKARKDKRKEKKKPPKPKKPKKTIQKKPRKPEQIIDQKDLKTAKPTKRKKKKPRSDFYDEHPEYDYADEPMPSGDDLYTILDNIQDLINRTVTPQQTSRANTVKQMLEDAMAREGAEAFLDRIQMNADLLIRTVQNYIYTEYLKGAGYELGQDYADHLRNAHSILETIFYGVGFADGLDPGAFHASMNYDWT